jgi:P-type Ca2+ transporter type 2C
MATFHHARDAAGRPVIRCFIKGAAPAVMARAATALSAGTAIPWDTALSDRATAAMERMAGNGQRVMAVATRDLDPGRFDSGADLLGYLTDVQMTSLVAMVDPPRAESAAAVASAQAAHIRVRMVTGDDVGTGAAIARQLGIEGEAMLGADFAALPEAERIDRIDRIGVVGRVAPEHKVLLANTLKKRGDVVAMTGDGVNDAPAIKAADIGIAMGTGTEVAKNAGRMILSDDNFATIVFAVEQGRKIYDNLAKYIRFVLVFLVVDSRQLNWVMLGEFVLAVLVTQMGLFNRLLGTVQIDLPEFGWALVPPVALLPLWELGKLIARRSARHLMS